MQCSYRYNTNYRTKVLEMILKKKLDMLANAQKTYQK